MSVDTQSMLTWTCLQRTSDADVMPIRGGIFAAIRPDGREVFQVQLLIILDSEKTEHFESEVFLANRAADAEAPDPFNTSNKISMTELSGEATTARHVRAAMVRSKMKANERSFLDMEQELREVRSRAVDRLREYQQEEKQRREDEARLNEANKLKPLFILMLKSSTAEEKALYRELLVKRD